MAARELASATRSATSAAARWLERVIAERRPSLEPDVFEDGEAPLEATKRLGMEGVVAKRRSEPYRPG
jgi:ATP-dependent DNA ligase